MKAKKLLALLLALAMCLSLAACGSSSSTTESTAPESTAPETTASEGTLAGQTILIGNIAPMTGALAAYGVAVDNGIRLAAKEINENGGILGGTIEISTKDDQHTPAESVSGFNALLSEGACAIIGSVASADTSAITSLANEEEEVLITATSTADSITTEDDYVFRSCFKDSFQGKMAAAFAASAGIKKAAILYASDDTYSSGLRDAFVAAAPEYGIEIVTEQATLATAVDFSSQLATITASDAEMVFAPYYYSTVGPYIVPQAYEAGFDGYIIGADGFDGTEGYAAGDLAAYDKVYFTNHYSSDDSSEKVQDFVAAYTEAYGRDSLNALAALAYDATYMLAQAIETAGSIDSSDIRDAMVGMHYVGVTGDMTLDETGTPDKSVTILKFEVQDGKLVQKFVKTQG
ncbi:MAG: ABC transporter substrate-binding protein [Oscillospiraceae bacterium]